MICLNPFLDSLCNFGFKNGGLHSGGDIEWFPGPQDVVHTEQSLPKHWLISFIRKTDLCWYKYNVFHPQRPHYKYPLEVFQHLPLQVQVNSHYLKINQLVLYIIFYDIFWTFAETVCIKILTNSYQSTNWDWRNKMALEFFNSSTATYFLPKFDRRSW